MHRFFLHYNKPASKTLKQHVWSVHFRGKCHIINNIQCKVATNSKINKRQPYVVMQGFADNIDIRDNTAIIY